MGCEGGREEGKEEEEIGRQGGDGKATGRKELRFPRFSNVVTPVGKANGGGGDCAVILVGMDASDSKCADKCRKLHKFPINSCFAG
jgi:hypothetical protein